MAEYTGAIIGLETAVELVIECGQPIPVQILGDSKLVTKQLKGQWEVRSQNLLPLYQRADQLVEELESLGCSVRLAHRFRAENKEADALANKAMDEKDSSTEEGDYKIIVAELKTRTIPPPQAQQVPADKSLWEPHNDATVPRMRVLPSADDPALETLLKNLHSASRPLGKLTRPKLWPEHHSKK